MTALANSDRVVLAMLDWYQYRYVLWLGEGDIQRGICRCVNFANDQTFNYPTPQGLDKPGELFDPEKDYEGYYAVNAAIKEAEQ